MNRSWVERVLLLVAGVVAAGWVVPCLMAQTQAEQAPVLAPIYALFDGMAKRDAAAIKAPVLPTATLVLMRDGNPVTMTIAEAAARFTEPGKQQPAPKNEERIHDPLVRIDNDLAMVWTPFDSGAAGPTRWRLKFA